MIYQVRSLDVWGHAAHECEVDDHCECERDEEGVRQHETDCERHEGCDGFTVNQSFAAGEIEVPEGATDAQIIETMIADGYLNEIARECASVDDYSDGTTLDIVDTATGEPLYSLQADDS